MWLLDLIFGPSEKSRYNFFLKREQAKSILSQLVKKEFVYGSDLATKVISGLKSNSATSRLIYGNDFVSRMRETELAEVIKYLYENNYISHLQFGSANQAVRKALKEIRERDTALKQESISAKGGSTYDRKAKKQEEVVPKNEVDELVKKELDQPHASEKDWRI